MQPSSVQVPVFVYPTPISFYLDDQTTHKQVLTLYNPYEFPIRFRVLCTSPNKFTVVDPEGSIRPRCCVDIVVRHNAVSSANCNITDKFRVHMLNHTTKQTIGKQDVTATLLPGRPSGPPVDTDVFQNIPSRPDMSRSSSVQQHQFVSRELSRGRLQSPSSSLAVTAAVICIIALMLPTQGDTDSRIPTYLHLAPHYRLAFAYVLGMVTVVLLKP